MNTVKRLEFDVESEAGINRIEFQALQLVMAGWTGRNREALQAHIDELAELDIRGPKSVPEFYPLSVDRLSREMPARFQEKTPAEKLSSS